MPDLDFRVESAESVPYAASPQLALKLGITNTGDEPIHSIMLRCQIQIEAVRRRYDAAEQPRLLDLFGEPHRWGQTLRTMLWTHISVTVPPFAGDTTVDLSVPCTFDFNVAAAKYFHALEGGEVPLCLLFNGTIFYHSDERGLQVAQVPWEKETYYRLPVEVWKRMMDHYYPDTAWLCLQRDIFDRLHRYKSENGIPTWEQTLDTLLDGDSKSEARNTKPETVRIHEI